MTAAALTPAFLADHFGAATVERAWSYVADGIDDVEVNTLSNGSVTATALAYGTRGMPYEVQLHAEVGSDLGRGWVFSVCTCPVRSMCKHGAALALVLHQRELTTTHTSGWERQLGRLADELTRRDDADPEPIALQFSIESGHRWGGRDHQLCLRPLRPGAKQRWIKSGADWSRIPGLVATDRLQPEQADALGALHFALDRHRGYLAAGDAPSLDQFGPQLPRLLRAAADAGVEFVTRAPIDTVTIAKEPAATVADLCTTDDDVTLTVGVDADGTLWHGEGVWMLGGDGRVAVQLVDGELRIAELTRPMTRSLWEVASSGPLRIPRDDVASLDERLAGLVRHLDVRSSDGSVAVPAPVPPTLVLTVTWHSSTEAELGWEWQYGAARCALGSNDRLGGLRDRPRELAVRARVPAGLLQATTLRGGDALEFALHGLPHLRALDDVEVVEVQRPEFRESAEAPQISFELAETPADHTDWLDLEVTVTVEGEAIPLPDVLAALTLGEEFLVLPSGLFVCTDLPELDRLREVVAAAAELRERDDDRLSVGKHDLGVWAQLAETGVVDAQAAEWVFRAQALRDLTDLPRPEPRGLATTMRPYQLDGFHWLSFLYQHGLGGILADDMGLGKTLQVLALIQHVASDPEQGADDPFLVVAPTSVVTAWRAEAQRHAPDLRIGVVSRRSDDVAAIAASSDVVVTTYTLVRLAGEDYAALPWSGLVLDEAQQVKNHQSKTYAAVRAIDAPFRLAVTGTPFENRLMELWALLSISVPGLYPWPRKFRDLVVRPVEKEGDTAALRRFQQRIRPFLLRRTKELVADDLPPKQEQLLEVDLGERHRRIYDTHLAKERQRILGLVDDFEANRVAIFAALTKLRQLALDPALVDTAHERVGSAKVDVLAEHLAEITAEGHQALVFSQFTSFLGRVRERLDAEGVITTYLDGATRDRAGVIDRFRDGEASVFLISLKAGGVGLTLTEADYVFVLDPWWNPAAEAQAVDRAHRIGQHRHVNVYRLVATNTIEEKVMALKARKAELFARVIDSDGAIGGGIDADDIRALFDG